jgi:hypothetical protein
LDPVAGVGAGDGVSVVICVGAGVGVGADGGVFSPMHPADIKTATIVTMTIKPVMDFFFVVFIVLARFRILCLNRPIPPNVRSTSDDT